jgi:hypothetical protein
MSRMKIHMAVKRPTRSIEFQIGSRLPHNDASAALGQSGSPERLDEWSAWADKRVSVRLGGWIQARHQG